LHRHPRGPHQVEFAPANQCTHGNGSRL
jgi:hypothetical protein